MGNIVDYFEMNGTKYYTGTCFKVKRGSKDVEAVFRYTLCGPSRDYISFMYLDTHEPLMVSTNQFPIRYFVEFTDTVVEKPKIPRECRLRDRDIPGMTQAWVLYIVLALCGFVMKGGGAWIGGVTAIFLVWRANKIKKEGSYIEW